jgi:hypothetical protein
MNLLGTGGVRSIPYIHLYKLVAELMFYLMLYVYESVL